MHDSELRRTQELNASLLEDEALLKRLEDELRYAENPVREGHLRSQIDRCKSRIAARRAELEELELRLEATAVGLAREVEEYLQLAGLKVVHRAELRSEEQAELVVERRQGRWIQRLLVLCHTGRATLATLRRLRARTAELDLSGGWLVTERRVPAALGRELEGDEELKASTLEDLFHLIFPLESYFRWLDEEFEKLRIDELFVDQACLVPLVDGSLETTEPGGSVVAYIDDWLDSRDKHHISVLGDFGTGKTWLCWFYAHAQLERYRRRPVRERIPLLISLREYQRVANVEALFARFCERHGIPHVSFELFRELNARGRLLIVLDGFDEMGRHVDDQKISENFSSLARFVTDNSKVILTCRTPYFRRLLEERQWFQDPRAQFDVVYLEEFDAYRIAQALEKRVGDDWPRVLELFKKTYNLADLARRPVMLTMAVETLPDLEGRERVSITDLYRSYTNKWIEEVGKERSFLSSAARRQFMRALAWRMFENEDQPVHFSEIPDLVRDHYGLQSKPDVDHYEHDIRTQSYLIRDAEGYYFFAHRSLGEYFVAETLHAEILADRPRLFGEHAIPPVVVGFLRDLELGPDTLFGWLERIDREHQPPFLAGNVLTLLHVRGYDLRNRDFSGLEIRQADLATADLTGSRFVGSRVDGVSIGDADLTGTDFSRAYLPNLNLGVRSAAKTVAASPDGRWVASGGGDSDVLLFDARTFQEVRRLTRHRDSITNVAFSPDGRWVASSGFDRAARLWRLDDGARVHRFDGHSSMVYDVAFSPDGRFLATAGHDRRVMLWDVESGQELQTLTGHTETVYTVEFQPLDATGEYRYLASGSFDRTVGLWPLRLEGGKLRVRPVVHLVGHEHLVNGISFSPDGRRLVSASNDWTLRIWEVAGGACQGVLKGHEATVWSAAYSPDGRHIASGSTDLTVRIWDAATGEAVARLTGHDGEVWKVCFSADGRYVLSGGHDSTMRVWDWAAGRLERTVPLPEDTAQKIRCDGMKLYGVTGLSKLQERFLIRKGAVQ